jgi:uncharacterized protein YcaQ
LSLEPPSIQISKQTARRFVAGRQGLWPGRRWQGKEGVVQALFAMEALQLDPLNVVARSHDIALWGRVLDYRPEYLDEALYQDRLFFDYGGGLFIYPMRELPYWRLHMEDHKKGHRWVNFIFSNQAVIEAVRAEIRRRGPLGNRDFEGTQRVNSYRGRKDTALALYYLWLTGELMIHHRKGFERVYDFRENIVPPDLESMVSTEDICNHAALKTVAFAGLASPTIWKNNMASYLGRKVSKQEGDELLDAFIQEGVLQTVRVEGSKGTWLVLSSDLPILDTLEQGLVPEAWLPIGPTTTDEAVILAPLEIISARGRSSLLFEFEYIWEVYKPVEKRRWGYYTIPILYGDRLVARLDPKLDRKASTLVINGFWLEDPLIAEDEGFVQAFGRCLARFTGFVEARRLDLRNLNPAVLRKRLAEVVPAVYPMPEVL